MLVEKIISGEITAIELTSKALKDELLTLIKNATKAVVDPVKKVMKFISKLSTGKQTIDLKAFYKAGNKKQPLYISSNFQKVLDEVIGEVDDVVTDETFYQHQNRESISDENAMAELSETIIDLSTVAGGYEARKRLATLAFFLSKQPKAQSGQLIITGYANVIGWFKTKDGSVFSLCAYWFSDDRKWYCSGRDLSSGWGAGRRFWSRNEPK